MDFTYHKIKLYKSESLGSGAYGGVCKAKCDGLLCAAKIMHPTLFDLRNLGVASYLRKFQEECHLLSLARHPNIVQYLGTYSDTDTQLPVLLMELCDESLTAFLEHSPGPLSYHLQLNICHDIALALVYLHSNGLIHRDLTGNNVLMITGTRAKITDFGMSKLVTVNPRTSSLTPCPGNILYMSPEALDEAKSYTAKLDTFSFGVIVIQILTRQFPNPTERFHRVHDAQYDESLRQVIPDTERRQAHLKLISDTHSLKPLAIQCLHKKENERPSALQLSERLSELKRTPQYTESMDQPQTSSNIQQLQQQLQEQRTLIDAKTREASQHQAQNTELQRVAEERQRTIEAKTREASQHQTRNTELQRVVEEKQRTIEAKTREVSEQQARNTELQRVAEERQKTSEAKTREASQHEARNTELQRVAEERQRTIEAKTRETSQHQARNTELQRVAEERQRMIDAKTREASQHEARNTELQRVAEEKQRTIEAKTREVSEQQARNTELQRVAEERRRTIEAKTREASQHQARNMELQRLAEERQRTIEAKTREVSEQQARNTELQRVAEERRRTIEAKTREASQHQARNTELQRVAEERQRMIDAKTREASQHQAQNTELQRVAEERQRTIDAKMREVSEHQAQITKLQIVVEEKQSMIDIQNKQLQQQRGVIETKERELQQIKEQLKTSEQVMSEFQKSDQQKDKTINDLQQTIAARDKKIQEMEQQPQLQRITTDAPMTVATAPADISRMTWREVKNAPEKMQRGAAVVHGNIAYIRPANSQKVYAYQNILGEEWWTRLPDNLNQGCGLTVVDDLLTSVGGFRVGYTNTLLSLVGHPQHWSEIFPPMPTPHRDTTCITTERALVVAGGSSGVHLDTVEVMNITTKQWSAVCSLPQKIMCFSGVACGDTLYLAGGAIGDYFSKSVFTCSLTDLWQPDHELLGSGIQQTPLQSSGRSNNIIWKEIRSLPVSCSTLVSFVGHLLAVGGENDTWNTTTDVYRYNPQNDSWNVAGRMKTQRMQCFAVALPHEQLVVVGGARKIGEETDSVEIWRN